MARPRKFEEVKVKSALRNVFWQYGFEGTSYPQITDATGLNKGSLYASFGDKRGLYQHALTDYDREYVRPGVAMLRNDQLTPKARLTALFASLVESAETPKGRWGCLLCNAAIDQAPFDPEVETAVAASLSRLRKAIKYCVKNTPAADKAEMIWTAYFGGRVMVKAGLPKSAMKMTQAQILALL